MPRLVGYNATAVPWNDAPWERSGYYVVSDSQAAAYNVTAPVSDSQAMAYNITNPIGDSQAAAYEIRQIAADSQAAAFDVTNSVGDSITPAFDVTNPAPEVAIQCGFGVAMAIAIANASLSRVGGDALLDGVSRSAALVKLSGVGSIERRTGNASLTRTG